MWIILVPSIFIMIYCAYIYNNIVNQIKNTQLAKEQLDLELDKRFKIFEQLINTARKKLIYEQTVLKDIVQVRAEAQSAKAKNDLKGQFEAEDKISQIANKIYLVFKESDELTALENAHDFKEEILAEEEELKDIQKNYNREVRKYRGYQNSWLSSLIISSFKPQLLKTFVIWR